MSGISTKERKHRLESDNPWWRKPGEIEGKNYTRRVYFPPFYELVRMTEFNRAIVLMGPRRVGKTVMSHQAIADLTEEGVNPKHILYVPLDRDAYSRMSLESILLAFLELNRVPKGERVYAFFDEIQYLENWEAHLKSLVDTYPQHRFVATGSAAAALKKKSTESGAGRFTDFTLPPLTFYEYMEFTDNKHLFGNPESPVSAGKAMVNIDRINEHFVEYINSGGYPETVLSDGIRKRHDHFIKSDVVEKVLEKDLPTIFGISDVPELKRLLTTIAHHTGQEINMDRLSKDAEVTRTTIYKYLEYLETAFLIRRVRRVDRNIKRFKRDHTFKVYLTNPSMYAALFGAADKENGTLLGRLVETAVFSHLFNIIRKLEGPYYARWNDGEVDLVAMDITGIKAKAAIEIKWSDIPNEDLSEIKGLSDFAVKNNLDGEAGRVVCLTKKDLVFKPSGNGMIGFMPASLFCLKLLESDGMKIF